MNLYLDDNSIKGSMVGTLRKAGHRVVLPADVGLTTLDVRDPLLDTHDPIRVVSEDCCQSWSFFPCASISMMAFMRRSRVSGFLAVCKRHAIA